MSDDQVATDISLFVVGRVTDAGADMVIAGLRDVEFEFVIAVSFPCFAAKCFVPVWWKSYKPYSRVTGRECIYKICSSSCVQSLLFVFYHGFQFRDHHGRGSPDEIFSDLVTRGYDFLFLPVQYLTCFIFVVQQVF